METTSVGYYIVGKYVQVFIKEHGLVTGLVNEYIPLVETYELVFDFGTTYMKLEPPVYVLNGPVVTKMYDTDSDDELQAAADRLLAQPAEDGWYKPTKALLAAQEPCPFFWPSAGAGKLSVADENGWFQPNIFLQRERHRPSIKDGGDVVHVPCKTTLVNTIITESRSGDEDDDEEMSTPFTAEDIRNMKQKELRQKMVQYNILTYPYDKTIYNSVPKMKEALMKKFGLEGSNLSDYQQKCKESSNALDAFLKFTNVVDITSTISNFNPKNEADAKSFMEQYRKKHGKGPTRSQNST